MLKHIHIFFSRFKVYSDVQFSGTVTIYKQKYNRPIKTIKLTGKLEPKNIENTDLQFTVKIL